MKWMQLLGGAGLLASLWVLYANVKPYVDLYGFWGQFGFPGIVVLNTWWFVTCGFTTLLGVGLLIVSIILLRRR